MDADYSTLLLHSAVRWLFRGRILLGVYDLKEKILVFIPIGKSEFEFLKYKVWWTKLSFLTYLFEHLNKLNSNMHGHNENILTLLGKNMDFIKKLNPCKIYIY